MESNDLKAIVQKKYGEIALQSANESDSSCCGQTAGCCSEGYTSFSETYDHLEGYSGDADLKLGCGIPTEFANIKEGDHVLDLGSGAGNDCFVVRPLVGEKGMVTGIDFTQEMVDKAKINAGKSGFENIHFVYGDIEDMPLPDDQFNVVVSNCVLNLVPDKNKAFREIYRVLTPGGHFCISDVVLQGALPQKLKTDAELYAGCVSGAPGLKEYKDMIIENGFTNLQIHKKRAIEIPHALLSKHLNDLEIKEFLNGELGIFSITVSAQKSI